METRLSRVVRLDQPRPFTPLAAALIESDHSNLLTRQAEERRAAEILESAQEAERQAQEDKRRKAEEEAAAAAAEEEGAPAPPVLGLWRCACSDDCAMRGNHQAACTHASRLLSLPGLSAQPQAQDSGRGSGEGREVTARFAVMQKTSLSRSAPHKARSSFTDLLSKSVRLYNVIFLSSCRLLQS